ncbi:MAG: dipeptidase [Candidatus Heimdallarchaeaceae archaeon]
MNDLGIIVDVSHLNEKSFWDVHEVANKPFIASHSNAYSICPHVRNLKDEQIEAINNVGGTIGINFATSFLSSKLKPEEITFKQIQAHIDHIVNVGSINSVSFGSDFDGAKVPTILRDISYYPKLIEYLERTYDKKEIEKMAYGNFLRVFKECWK